MNRTTLWARACAAAIMLSSAVCAQTVTYTYSYAGPALPIFRDSANIITGVSVFVPKAIIISKAIVQVEIDYPHPGDLNVYVYSPLLTRTKLLERNCGDTGSVSNVTFDDAAATRYSESCPTTAGSFRGNEPLSNFNGQDSLGTWRLAVENNGSDNFIGYVRGFTVTITGTAENTKPITGPNAVYNAAGFQSGTVAPGEMVNIEGANLGPTTGTGASAGDLPTSLGGVSVTFDGVAAALSYVSADVLTVQVPFSVTPGGTTSMIVTSGGNSSDKVSLDVATAVPGIYTVGGANGIGLASAVNPDGTTNSAANPASRGDYVAIYASGLGAVTPSLNTGQSPPSSPLSNTTAPVSALVNGISAPVAFAGAAPGYPGLYQINVQIPTNAHSGLDSLLIAVEGATSSQYGVGIFVK